MTGRGDFTVLVQQQCSCTEQTAYCHGNDQDITLAINILKGTYYVPVTGVYFYSEALLEFLLIHS